VELNEVVTDYQSNQNLKQQKKKNLVTKFKAQTTNKTKT